MVGVQVPVASDTDDTVPYFQGSFAFYPSWMLSLHQNPGQKVEHIELGDDDKERSNLKSVLILGVN